MTYSCGQQCGVVLKDLQMLAAVNRGSLAQLGVEVEENKATSNTLNSLFLNARNIAKYILGPGGCHVQ